MAHLKVSLPTHPILHAGLRLDVDAERAEEQELEQGGLADTLKEIVGRTMPSPRYVRFHEAHVQRYLSRLKAFPPRCDRSLTLHYLPNTLACSYHGVRRAPMSPQVRKSMLRT